MISAHANSRRIDIDRSSAQNLIQFDWFGCVYISEDKSIVKSEASSLVKVMIPVIGFKEPDTILAKLVSSKYGDKSIVETGIPSSSKSNSFEIDNLSDKYRYQN